MFFVMSLRLSDHINMKIFSILLGFSCFFCSYLIFVLQIFGVKKFNKTIIPFTLVGYETGYSQLISNAHSWNNYC